MPSPFKAVALDAVITLLLVPFESDNPPPPDDDIVTIPVGPPANEILDPATIEVTTPVSATPLPVNLVAVKLPLLGL